MDDETFQKMSALALLLCLIGIFFIYQNTIIIKKASDVDLTVCSGVVDMIYEQCSEEGGINITTIKGKNKELFYDRGVCVIRTPGG